MTTKPNERSDAKDVGAPPEAVGASSSTNRSGPREDDGEILSAVGPRISKRATPLAPRSSEVHEIELERLARVSASAMADVERLGVGLGLEGRPGVVGYVTADPTGTVSSVGEACIGPFPDRIHYFAELARLVGVELGFEKLLELHATAEKHRVVWTSRSDGGWAAAITLPSEPANEVTKTLRGER